jgi:hypothetical protein
VRRERWQAIDRDPARHVIDLDAHLGRLHALAVPLSVDPVDLLRYDPNVLLHGGDFHDRADRELSRGHAGRQRDRRTRREHDRGVVCFG